MVITMAKLRMAHASMHGARKPPGPKRMFAINHLKSSILVEIRLHTKKNVPQGQFVCMHHTREVFGIKIYKVLCFKRIINYIWKFDEKNETDFCIRVKTVWQKIRLFWLCKLYCWTYLIVHRLDESNTGPTFCQDFCDVCGKILKSFFDTGII